MSERHRVRAKSRPAVPAAPSWGAALIAAAVTCTGPAHASSGLHAGVSAAPARASVDLAIRIPQVLSLTTLHSRRTIDVAKDGAVRVEDAASFEIRSNLPGYGLRFEITDPDVASVEVEGLDQAVVVPPAGRVVRFASDRGRRTLRRTLAYRVVYRHGARPGRRPMPVAYSLIGE
jgi:hypothetical protein